MATEFVGTKAAVVCERAAWAGESQTWVCLVLSIFFSAKSEVQ